MACASPGVAVGPRAWLLSGASAADQGGFVAGRRVSDQQALLERAVAPRLHLQHGPIDLVITADGRSDEVHDAFQQAAECFADILDILAGQLPRLRQLLRHDSLPEDFKGEVAQRMHAAAMPHVARQVTPMIAVAGAVADHVLQHLLAGRKLDRVQVNNGGDIALYLAPGQSSRIGICPSPMSSHYSDIVTLKASSGVGGVATSGWQGRSHSLGIADAVTVLAGNAAIADTAATLIANAVDLPGSLKVVRASACSLTPDSDLGDRLVTIDVRGLTASEKTQALQAGEQCARQLLSSGLLQAACLHVQGQSRVVGSLFDHHHLAQENTGT
ncbi:UPF0280 family protein [Granulosicoccus sp. 3-233]|uniref:UPF0280 family protein n=1 Tax=Granulosicoccus sp. 3-233 TaxID=3417969 RepID=UPI003D33EA2B